MPRDARVFVGKPLDAPWLAAISVKEQAAVRRILATRAGSIAPEHLDKLEHLYYYR
jgi:hypothetical protein